MSRWRRGRWVLGAALTVVVVAAPVAAQPPPLDLEVRDTDFAADGSTELLLTLSGPGKPDVIPSTAFAVREDGEPIDELTVEPLIDTEEFDVTVALALDTSGSMRGAPLDAVKTSATRLVTTLTEQDIPVALLEFDAEASVIAPATTDTTPLIASIGALEASGGTALYDAVVAGVAELQDAGGETRLIVLADGEDNVSEATLTAAIDAAARFDVPVTFIAFGTEAFDASILQPLADETGGRFVTSDDVAELDAVFAQVADEVASQYRLRYVSEVATADELEVGLVVEVGGVRVERTLLVANPRTVPPASDATPAPRAAPLFDAGRLGTPTALISALGAAFLALLLLTAALVVPLGDRRAARTLRRGLTLTERRERPARPSAALSASTIGERALAVINSTPKPKGYEDRLQADLDRAGWHLRSSEFIAVRLGGAVAGFALLAALSGRFWLGVLGGLGGSYGPDLALINARRRRLVRFMEQLPSTLQLLSGTLKAGYGILQGIDTVVKETQAPTSVEFQRVLTEARLGLPLEDSLQAMAERIGSDDFRWVVVAMNIQRQVGGNLADLLETVAETLRGRGQTQRQIQVLSAEGRLSAVILVALPFLLLLYLLVTNPLYLAPLVTNPAGWLMSAAAVVLMGLGVLWITRMIKIDV